MEARHGIINDLIAHLGEGKVLYGTALRDRYVHIWKMDIPLKARALILPGTTGDVSAIMKICYRYDQTVVIHGGLTNLVGSTETRSEDIVISMEKMNAIEAMDSDSRTITVQAGVILENIHQATEKESLMFPLNFGAKGTAQIGGIISTNAGGLRVFRFGMTRNLVLGLEVVLADGRIISSMKKIIKDNSGYDIKHYFIGSEGTLGIITRAVLKLVEAPKTRNSAFVALNHYTDVVQFLKFCDQELGAGLSGFELIWGETYEAMTSPPSKNSPPLPHGYGYYVLVETLGSHADKDRDNMEACLEKALLSGNIADAAMAFSQSDLDWFWTIREDVHVLTSQCTYDQHFDISLPIDKIGEHAAYCQKNIKAIPQVEHVFTFGHVADGNIHFIIGKNNEEEALFQKINNIVYPPLREIGGSVSAEHGIGLHKKPYLSVSRTPEEIDVMKMIKKALDPKGLLNRGKVLD